MSIIHFFPLTVISYPSCPNPSTTHSDLKHQQFLFPEMLPDLLTISIMVCFYSSLTSNLFNLPLPWLKFSHRYYQFGTDHDSSIYKLIILCVITQVISQNPINHPFPSHFPLVLPKDYQPQIIQAQFTHHAYPDPPPTTATIHWLLPLPTIICWVPICQCWSFTIPAKCWTLLLWARRCMGDDFLCPSLGQCTIPTAQFKINSVADTQSAS